MKKLIISSFTICISLFGFAQNTENNTENQQVNNKDIEIKNLIGKDKISHGAYLGLSVGYANLNTRNAVMANAKLAWIIDHHLAFGISASGFSEDLWSEINNSTKNILNGGYCGLVIEPIIRPAYPIHLSIPVIAGVGGVSMIRDYNWNDYTTYYYGDDFDAYFIVEPGIEVEANLIKYVRLNLFCSYRITSPVYLFGVKRYPINGISTGIGIKIGKF